MTDRIPQIVAFEQSVFGPCPFEPVGAIVDHAPNLGYALESQTKPNFDSAPDIATLAHELAHQWYGDSVSLTEWQDIWLNEGFATCAEWLSSQHTGGRTPQQIFDRRYATPASAGPVDAADRRPGRSGEHLRHTLVRPGRDDAAGGRSAQAGRAGPRPGPAAAGPAHPRPAR